MANTKIKITVVRQEGTCSFGHKVGDSYLFEDHLPDVCPYAWVVIYPYILALQNGGEFDWGDRPGACYCGCSDSRNPVEFLLERIP